MSKESENQNRRMRYARTHLKRSTVESDPLSDAAKKGRLAVAHQNNIGADFTDDEFEFMKAMDAYKRKYQRPWPGFSEILAVLRSLGYQKLCQEESCQEESA